MSDELITAMTSLVSAFLLFVVVKVTTVIKRKIKEVREEKNDNMTIIHDGDIVVVAPNTPADAFDKNARVCKVVLMFTIEDGSDKAEVPYWYLEPVSIETQNSKEADTHDTESDSISS